MTARFLTLSCLKKNTVLREKIMDRFKWKIDLVEEKLQIHHHSALTTIIVISSN